MKLLDRCALTAVAMLGVAVSGCASASRTLVLPPLATTAFGSSVRFVVKIGKTRGPGLRPDYVSPATKSMHVAIFQGTKDVLDKTVALTLSSEGCRSSLTTISCDLQVTLAAGKYTASVSTYDHADGKGKLLSLAQNVPFTVAESGTTVVPLTLSGVPESIRVTQAGALSISVVALDANGNYIVGDGAPSFKGVKSGGADVATIIQPTTEMPNTIAFALQKQPVTGTERIGVKARFPGSETDACKQSGAVCSVTPAAMLGYGQGLYVANYYGGNVLGFNLPLSSSTQAPMQTLDVPSVYLIALDRHDDLFVVENRYADGPLFVFAPPYTGPPASNSHGIYQAEALAVDEAGDAFVASYWTPAYGYGAVTVYPPPYTTTSPTTISNSVHTPYAVAVDRNRNLYVANANDSVTVYAPPYTSAPSSVLNTSSVPLSLMIANKKLFVGETSNVDVFDLPLTGTTPSATLSSGVSWVYALTTDAHGSLWFSNTYGGAGGVGSIEEFTSPFQTGQSPVVTIAVHGYRRSGLRLPYSLNFDEQGNLYVVDEEGPAGGGGVAEYVPPFKKSSTPALSLKSSLFNYPYYAVITKRKTLRMWL